jgi:signal transduction histidine kinase
VSGTLTRGLPTSGGDMAPAREEARLSETELRQLLAVGRSLVAELDLESVLDQVLRTARELTGARYAAIGVLDEKKKELARFLFVGIDEEQRRRIGPLHRGHGLLSELIRRPEPLRLHDVTAHPRSYGFPPEHPPMKSFLGVPIRVRNEVYGNLYLTDKEGGADFHERDQESVVVLADWAAIAIDNARLYTTLQSRHAELERAVRGLEATAVIARSVGTETDLDRVLELVVKRGRALIDARSLVVVLECDGEARVAAVAGEAGEAFLGHGIDSTGTVAGSALSAGASERIADLASRVGHGLGRLADGATAALVAPLAFRAGTRGLLVAFDRLSGGPAFEADDEHILNSFAASAAIAIATAQSVEDERRRNSVEASEQERRRWARELHDETLQELGALKVLLQGARQSDPPEAMTAAMDQAVEQIQLSISGLQGLITELRPAALDELGTGPALDALIKRTAATSGLDIRARVDLDYEQGRTPYRHVPEVETAIYRIVQESLTNVIKHAAAEHVEIDLIEAAGRVAISVRDDGAGFDPTQRADGFGLLGMRERVSLVAGDLVVQSTPGGGTTVTASLPSTRRDAATGEERVRRQA